jgi:hypothetical protein
MDEDDDLEEGGEEETSGGDSEFGIRWKWIATVDRVSETIRDSWEKVFDMNIYEFFNVLCYSIDKANEEKRQLEMWKRKH